MTGTLDRRRHYVIENGPRSWEADLDIARWLVALCLHSVGRADAIERADDIVPRHPARDIGLGLSPSEQLALAAAMYAAWSSGLQWKAPRVAAAFGVSHDTAWSILSSLASDINASPTLRSGINGVCLVVREAMMERARG